MSDLDDFFAKKDKTKRNKKKGLNDDLNKKFETKISEKSREKFSSNLGSFVQDEAEWNDFVDEADKDYSGLKIQPLNEKDKEEEQREEEELAKKEQAGTPWMAKKEDGEPEKKEEISSAAAPSKPANAGAEQQLESILMAFSGSRARGPRINDAIEFPGLGTPKEAYEEPRGFQTVRTMGANKASTGQGNESIATDNKYNALRNNSN